MSLYFIGSDDGSVLLWEKLRYCPIGDFVVPHHLKRADSIVPEQECGNARKERKPNQRGAYQDIEIASQDFAPSS